MTKTQTRWAIVFANGFINHGYMRFTRKDVVAEYVATYRNYRSAGGYAGLTDAQFWRILKRRRGLTVRRIALRVVR